MIALRSSLFVFLLLFCARLEANCSGCCYRHGGVECRSGVTMCRDGTPLSARCQEKSCNKCEGGGRQSKGQFKRSSFEGGKASKALKGGYRREDWMPRGWEDGDKDCQRTRDEVLSRDNLALGPKGPCKVTRGEWRDFYSSQRLIREARQADIDHVVALKEAHDYGGAGWPREKKLAFAQDMENLVVTTQGMNREKGAQSPATWLPSIQRADACRYLSKWKYVIAKYRLSPPAEVLAHVQATWKYCVPKGP